jgi:hypothetical protein
VSIRGLLREAAPGGRSLLEVHVHGAPWRVPLERIETVAFASDRIRFLSDLEPLKVSETGWFDQAFPYRRNSSLGGGPLRLRGLEYAKGLGVHSRTVLEYPLQDGDATFAARVGIDDAVGRRGDARVQVLGDGKTLFTGRIRGGGEVLEIIVRVSGLSVLRLETDFGDDGIDLGDHVDWVEARIVKRNPASPPPTASETPR